MATRTRTRTRMRSRSRSDIGTIAVVGAVCAVVGFFVLGIVLGPLAIIFGWLAMGRSWRGAKSIPAVVAVVLGAFDTVVAVLWLAQ
ncbi:small hydrophobic protein [Streptomyces sp. SID13666]|uniref:small hydrophobic protein n=1 Tax=Streptomyces TaxID=1883 RepID=UPI001106229F|nr:MULTISPECIES: small hydrophobic protein [Streptomyces]MCZ4098230.1 small hydrophobic protein [Streptomyces sp. H39-C1]NEA55539.1 small hydrophobic protein [Streptomyces sp. SID13666]NEA71742.1 small hydrophobic protein [Streptomyces sp. SID13588]QNA73255.1 small hydrophobic protein [Streptomyces sp. So13.3]